MTDVWERRPDADMGFPGELIYADHARLFGRAEGDGAFSKKSAALGLVWANQVNARIMLARTERRHHYYDYRYDRHNRTHSHLHHHHGAPPAAAATALPSEAHDRRKRQRLDGDDEDVVQVFVRRLTVVFSSVCAPASVDFIVTSRGVEMLVEDLENAPAPVPVPALAPPTTLTNVTTGLHAVAASASEVGRPPPQPPLAEVAPLDVGSVVGNFRPPQVQPQPGETAGGEVMEEDEDAYWREVDDFPFSSDSGDLVQGTNPLS